MITVPEYKVMGVDGQEYGPVYAEQIRQWFTEGRVDKKTPTLPAGTKDWVFLESLPEFADLFRPPPPPPKRFPLPWLLVIIAGSVLVLLLVALWLMHKKTLHH